jgi:hypothetical protein
MKYGTILIITFFCFFFAFHTAAEATDDPFSPEKPPSLPADLPGRIIDAPE